MSEKIEYFVEGFDDADGIFIKVLFGHQIIASLLAEIENDELILHSVNVNREHRRKGIASQMMGILKNKYPQAKVNGVLLSQDNNLSSKQLAEFYQKNGIASENTYRGKIGV